MATETLLEKKKKTHRFVLTDESLIDIIYMFDYRVNGFLRVILYLQHNGHLLCVC